MNTVKILKLDSEGRSPKKIIKAVENSDRINERVKLCCSNTSREKRKMRKRKVWLLFHNIV